MASRMMAGAVFATAVVITLILAGHQLGSRLQLQKPCGPAPECLHALGGGLIASGGGFDHHVTLPQCTEQLARYAADDGAYWTEVELAINMAFEALQLDPVCDLLPGRPHPQQQQKHSKLYNQQLRKQQQQQQQQGQTPARKLAAPQTQSTTAGAIHLPDHHHHQQQQQQVPGHGRFPPRPTPPPTLPPPSQDQLIIFDIDETVLSNLQHLLHPEPNSTWDDWVQAADAPPLGPSRCLYLSLLSVGYSVAFLTGRGEAQREATMRNLEAAGYGVPCAARAAQHGEGAPSRGGAARPADPSSASVCYTALLMRAPGDTRLASVFKPSARQQLLEGAAPALVPEGKGDILGGALPRKSGNYTLLALLGDQFSDIVGDVSAPYAFKLPNPFYYIL